MADWSEIEVELIIADYFDMLHKEIKGIPYNKSEHRRRLIPKLNNRDGAVEFKHQNISAALINFGLPYIKGYKPRWHYQKELLEKKILDFLSKKVSVEKDFNDFANSKIEIVPGSVHFEKWNVNPPDPKLFFEEPIVNYFKPIKRNYLELEQKNSSIGVSGEKLVYEYEQWRLTNAGYPKLAKEVKWISKDLGDGAGYDILSKNKFGEDIFIEVKTTTLGKETPIFFSKTENDFSEEKKEQFNLYRVFELKNQPKMFCLHGKFKNICSSIEANSFKGFF